MMREVEPRDPERVYASVEALKQTGFINYFGMQRFGSRAIKTHEIGRALLSGEWEKAVDFIMIPMENGKKKKKELKKERQDFQKARLAWKENKDAKEAMKLFPRSCVAEHAILSYFDRIGNTTECEGAVKSVKRPSSQSSSSS